jgi:tripartite-type tricarboxylate transporter receptor subunit TctC
MWRPFLNRLARLGSLGACLCLCLSLGAARAQAPVSAYPERTVRIVVPFSPGAGTDAMGRLMARKLGQVLGDNFVVENRAGASGAIGAQHVAQQPPDGYTLLLLASPFTTVAASMPSAGYDPLREFAPVGMITTGPLVWATNNKLPANGLRELVAMAKRKPGVLNYGSAGAGGVNHLVLELLKSRTGTYITHIPYRGMAPAILDLISDQVQLVTGTVAALMPFIRDGRVKALAVTSAGRSDALPNVPSMAESGLVGFDVVNYFALAAPVGTPQAIVKRLNAAIRQIVTMPDVLAQFTTDAMNPAAGSPASLGRFIEADYRAWRNVVTTQNLRVE